VTVTGCLQEAAAAPTGTSGSGSAATTDAAGKAASEASKYVLADAASSSSNASASGTQAATAKTYRLIVNDSAMTPHVGKKLELTGTLEGQDASSTASGSSQPQLRVESGKVVAADCKP